MYHLQSLRQYVFSVLVLEDIQRELDEFRGILLRFFEGKLNPLAEATLHMTIVADADDISVSDHGRSFMNTIADLQAEFRVVTDVSVTEYQFPRMLNINVSGIPY